MRLQKQILAHLPHCYAAISLPVHGRDTHLFASDDRGPCIAIDAQTLAVEQVLPWTGGTMSLIPLPNTDGELLASQNFMPGFAAKRATIVRLRHFDGRWRVQPWMDLPYVHRFDIIEGDGRYWFLGCILSETEKDQADFSVAGSLVAGALGPGMQPPAQLHRIAGDMHKNHGYCRTTVNGEEWILVACEEGIFRAFPPRGQGAWHVAQLAEGSYSDVAICDMDADGKPEMITLSPFHGNEIFVLHDKNGKYEIVHRVEHRSSFLHAIWAGSLCGRNIALIGGRAGEEETMLIQWKNGEYSMEVVEKGCGASNFFVNGNNILIANREVGECAILSAAHSDGLER